MSETLYLYTHVSLANLEKLVKSHQDSFDEELNDLFSEEELQDFERQVDGIAAVYVQPVISELTFDDFSAKAEEAAAMRSFFDACKSSIVLENLPYLQSNPFQVSYLVRLLHRLDEALVDTGGVNELVFKAQYLSALEKYKKMEDLISLAYVKKEAVKPKKPLDPIDFLVQDVFKEYDRILDQGKLYEVTQLLEAQSEKQQMLFRALGEDRSDAAALLRNSGLIPKDFDDNLERMKFFLRKLV